MVAFHVAGMSIILASAAIGTAVIIDLLALLLTCDSIYGTLTSNASNVNSVDDLKRIKNIFTKKLRVKQKVLQSSS